MQLIPYYGHAGPKKELALPDWLPEVSTIETRQDLLAQKSIQY